GTHPGNRRRCSSGACASSGCLPCKYPITVGTCRQGIIADRSRIVRDVDDDQGFKALADPTRRHLLDRLFERDGRRLTDVESELEMTRFGVMKPLRVLEDAGLVVIRRQGREKLHYLNPVPIR